MGNFLCNEINWTRTRFQVYVSSNRLTELNFNYCFKGVFKEKGLKWILGTRRLFERLGRPLCSPPSYSVNHLVVQVIPYISPLTLRYKYKHIYKQIHQMHLRPPKTRYWVSPRVIANKYNTMHCFGLWAGCQIALCPLHCVHCVVHHHRCWTARSASCVAIHVKHDPKCFSTKPKQVHVKPAPQMFLTLEPKHEDSATWNWD